MERSGSTSTSGERYCSPILKVRLLIEELDSEIRNLCKKCAATKSKGPVEVIIRNLGTTSPQTESTPQDTALDNRQKQDGKNALKESKSEAKQETKPVSKPEAKPESKPESKPVSKPESKTQVATFRSKSGGEELDNSVKAPDEKANCIREISKLNFEVGMQMRTLSTIYRNRVLDAYKDRRIFTVYGNYYTVRKALLHRGWLEKLPPGRYTKLQQLSEEVLLNHAKKGNNFEAVIISKIISTFPPFFIWQPKNFRDNYADVHPYRNRVRRGRALDYTTKIGLIGCAEQEHWYRDEFQFHMSYPRFYRLGGTAEERLAFINDFRFTQCRCLLNFIIDCRDKLYTIADEENGGVGEYLVRFALAKMQQLINELEHNDIDHDVEKSEQDEAEWINFLENSQKVIKRKIKIRIKESQLEKYAKEAQVYMVKIENKFPDCKWDGCRNLWILKPGYQSQGVGIIVRNNLTAILDWATNNQHRRYIAQKYIERPLLIYKTKFDIRQYMLLTIGESYAAVWLYKDCYLRFSSHEFDVDDFRDVIHLTNNSVQKRYKDKVFTRDPRLPRSNMWSSDQFKAYLKQINQPDDIWERRIFPGFCQNLVAVVLASFEETQFVENSFEFYGCDFMLDEMLNPILIELNSTPDLSPSTEITARICPNALKDLIKVVVDLPRNPRAPTGLFEKVYEINYKTLVALDNKNGFDITGVAMTLQTPKKEKFPQRLTRRSLPAKKYVKPVDVVKTTNKYATMHVEVKEVNKLPYQKIEVHNKYLRSNIKNSLALRYTLPK